MSGSIVGGGGSGKSNLIGFLCARPDVLQAYLGSTDDPVLAVHVDLNDLPDSDLATFHRVILRSGYEARRHLSPGHRTTIEEVFQAHRTTRDPFVTQTALREWLLLLVADGMRVVLVLDRFDAFADDPPPWLMSSLRALRDTFKDRLMYFVGMRQPARYHADPAIWGELYEVLDSHVCWVGAMAPSDARRVVETELDGSVDPAVLQRLSDLAGGYPAVVKSICQAWTASLADEPDDAVVAGTLMACPPVRHRLFELWDGLTQAEQAALVEVRRLASRIEDVQRADVDEAARQRHIAQARERLDAAHGAVLVALADRRLCERQGDTWSVCGAVLAAFILDAATPPRGTLWRDAATDELYLGQTPLAHLANLEARLLRFLLAHPRTRHTKSDLVQHVWPEGTVAEGVSDEALYQVVKEVRRKIEPHPAVPCYLVTWRGKPEGGYQLFPEGRPSV